VRRGGHDWQTKGAFAWIHNTQLGAPELSRGPRLAGFAAADVPAAGTPRAAGGTGRRLLQTAPNKFTCLVESSWMSPFDSPEFRHPQIRGPLCYNPYETRRPGWRQPEPGPMSFMISRDRYLGHVQGPGISHLMFHAPKLRTQANLRDSPVVLDDREVPEPETIFFAAAGHWLGGTAAPIL